MALLSLPEAKTLLNLQDVTTYDDELIDYINMAQECVDSLCGPTEQVTVTETIASAGEIALRTTPVLSVTSIDGQRHGALDLANLWIDNASGVIRPNAVQRWTVIRNDDYAVTYVAGRATVPASIKQGVRIILAHQWAIRRASIGTARPNIGADDSTPNPALGYAIPNRALQILAPYMLGPSVG